MGAGAALIAHERGQRMAERVGAAVALALGQQAAERVHHVVTQALLARHELDPQDPRYLHPGRIVLILLEDGAVRDEVMLAAGASLETCHPHLAVPELALAGPVRALLERVPRPGPGIDDDALREALVTAEDDARLVALVERLDHARHLHLYPEPEWRPLFAGIRAAYLPVAEWRGGLIGARFRRWADAFERRLGAE